MTLNIYKINKILDRVFPIALIVLGSALIWQSNVSDLILSDLAMSYVEIAIDAIKNLVA